MLRPNWNPSHKLEGSNFTRIGEGDETSISCGWDAGRVRRLVHVSAIG